MHEIITFENDIKELDPRKVYKYLGIEESFDIQHKNEKEKLKKEYLRRLRLVLSTELSAKNTVCRYSHRLLKCIVMSELSIATLKKYYLRKLTLYVTCFDKLYHQQGHLLSLTFWRRIIFFLMLTHPVYKM